ncbi:TetR family transcriptional regulator [Pedobacter sp. HMF7647]|uniref:TetR family transcriptional regulator n=1 Tax=Hufsiella arboris TaxID=2695275 RepID=A0A7K1Y4W9_9SPHI|nr:TetR/AcrR family transcriptional regulator [Hufsiella arboris]MXV49625.1 TetR family transcriptional regulator [Hufsiella arboris]
MTAEKTDKKKEAILDAAELLFSQFGYEGASTRLIASEAGVNMAMLSYYFGSKDGVYKAVIERRLLSSRQQLNSINNLSISSWEKLKVFIDSYADKLMTNNCFHKIVQRELSLKHKNELTDYISDSVYKNALEIMKIIQDGIDNGSFRKVNVEMLIATIFGTKYYIVNSTHISSRLLGKDLQDDRVMQEEVKPQVKEYLYDLLKTYLTKHETEV